MWDVIIIGAGAVGACLARELSKYGLSLLVLEKAYDVGDGASMANSGIVHSGYDPLPGSNKAFHNVRGNRLFPALCRDLDVPFRQIGSLTVACDEEGVETLQALALRAKENDVEARIVLKKELREIEPNISDDAVAALLCPSAGIVDPFLFVAHAMECACDNGAKIKFGAEAKSVAKTPCGYLVEDGNERYECRCLVNASGLNSAHISRSLGLERDDLIPTRGQYHVLDHFGSFVNHVLFPLPSQKGKGVLVTPTTSGNYLVGPSAERLDAPDLSTDSETLSLVAAQASRLVKSLPIAERIRVFSGIRSKSKGGDFSLSMALPGYYEFYGIDSPGLASSPSLAIQAAEEITAYLGAKRKERWKGRVKPYLRLSSLSLAAREEKIKENPDYGEIVCCCEKISLGEIKDALHRSLPCLTVKGLKKRTRAGFGKCQGGFCQMRVLQEIAKANGIGVTEVRYGDGDSFIVKGERK